MKTTLYIIAIGFIISSCGGNNEKTNKDSKGNAANNTQQTDAASAAVGTPEKVEVEYSRPETPTKDYHGRFFKVSVPEDFTGSPDGPKDTYPESDKEYIETDEAKFLSPDGEVEFYIYSPQWGGEASYEVAKENEKLISSKSSEKNTDLDGLVITTYTTFGAKDGSYTRAMVSIETENTNKTFGIMFKSQEAYDLYKAEYLKFKKSLEQYAD